MASAEFWTNPNPATKTAKRIAFFINVNLVSASRRTQNIHLSARLPCSRGVLVTDRNRGGENVGTANLTAPARFVNQKVGRFCRSLQIGQNHAEMSQFPTTLSQEVPSNANRGLRRGRACASGIGGFLIWLLVEGIAPSPAK
jgi:hypothetical protein